MFNLGIIGAGRIGRVHAKAAAAVPNAVIKMIVDPVAPDLEEFAKSSSIARTSRDYKDVLSDKDIDGVLICSPSDTHYAVSMDAIKAGKHVFCEKPIDLDVTRVLEIKKASEASGKAFMVGFNRRFDREFSSLKEYVSSGVVGNVELIEITSRDSVAPPVEYVKSSGGIYCDMMIHDLDMVRFLSGREVVSVYASGVAIIDPEIGKAGDVDTAVVALELDNGARAVITNSRRTAYGYDQRAEIHGSKASVMNGNHLVNNSLLMNEKGILGMKPLHFFLERYIDAYSLEIVQFIEAARSGKKAPVGVEDALQALLMAKAAMISQKEGRKVLLSEVK
ncbi:MAG: inositol 2-dehydrogenase [Brevinema sp.]